jgi:predicted O-methyltransferase YrrM
MKIAFKKTAENHLKRCKEARVATGLHLDYLRELAGSVMNVVELGVNRGASTVALALGCQGGLTSYEYNPTKYTRKLKRMLGPEWKLRIKDTRTVQPDEAPECCLLFVDSLHTHDQVAKELAIFAPKTRRYIVFHDTVTFGQYGADGETGKVDQSVKGIMSAIMEFVQVNPEWQLVRHVLYGHGLLTLEKLG